MTSVRRLCRLEDIPEGQAKAYRVEGLEYEVFVHHESGGARAYLNSCPHQGTPLDWAPDKFIAPDGEHFLCATHGALFRIEDGVCVAGPCAGARLRSIPVAVENCWVLLV